MATKSPSASYLSTKPNISHLWGGYSPSGTYWTRYYAGAKILGNIEIGRGAKIGAGSVVLHEVPAHTTVAGVPARIVGRPDSEKPSFDMDQHFNGVVPGFECGDGI